MCKERRTWDWSSYYRVEFSYVSIDWDVLWDFMKKSRVSLYNFHKYVSFTESISVMCIIYIIILYRLVVERKNEYCFCANSFEECLFIKYFNSKVLHVCYYLCLPILAAFNAPSDAKVQTWYKFLVGFVGTMAVMWLVFDVIITLAFRVFV